jgi:hypothetical protein
LSADGLIAHSLKQTANLGGVFRPGCPLLLSLLLAPAAALAQGDTRAEQQFANYAFAHELGSGLYQAGEQLLQIYRLPLRWEYREATRDTPGISLLLPATIGFLDFEPGQILEHDLPDRIDSISFVPGIGLEFLSGNWSLRPFARMGVEIADQSKLESTLFSVGVYNEYRRQFADGWRLRFRDDLLYSGVNYRGELPSDTFLRWRNAIEGSNAAQGGAATRALETGFFAVLDWYIEPPTGLATGIDIPELQFEVGMMLGTRPALRWGRVPIPRIGLSYRFAGDVSAWRLVLGAPF